MTDTDTITQPFTVTYLDGGGVEWTDRFATRVEAEARVAYLAARGRAGVMGVRA